MELIIQRLTNTQLLLLLLVVVAVILKGLNSGLVSCFCFCRLKLEYHGCHFYEW